MEHKVCLMLRFNDLTKSSGDNIMGFCGYVVDTISGASPWILATQDSRLKTQDSRPMPYLSIQIYYRHVITLRGSHAVR